MLRKQQYCGEVIKLTPQSTTSTTAKVRLLHVSGANQLAEELIPKFTHLIEELTGDEQRDLAARLSATIPDVVEEALMRLRQK